MFKNLAATDLVAARSPTSRRLLCNLAGTDRGPCSVVATSAIGENCESLRGRRAVAVYV